MNELMAAAKLNGMETVYLVTSGMDGVNRFMKTRFQKISARAYNFSLFSYIVGHSHKPIGSWPAYNAVYRKKKG